MPIFKNPKTPAIKFGAGGFTLIELMMGLFMASIIVYSAFSLYVSMHKEMLVQEVVSDTQANARAATEALSYMIGNAGYNIPPCLNPIETSNANPDTILVNFDSGIIQNVQLTAATISTSDDLICLGNDLTGLVPGDWAYIYDPNANDGEFFLASGVDYDNYHISHAGLPLSRLYPVGSTISKINRIRFYVDRADTTQPKLMVQHYGSSPQIFADYIYDMNFRYFMSNGAVVTQTNSPYDIRMVEIDVVGRSYRQDITPNGYCTRNFSLKVRVRNLEMST